VTPYDGDLESYKTECLAAAREERKAASNRARPARADNGARQQEARRVAALSRAEIAPLKKRAELAEREIAKIAREIARLDAQLGDNSLYEREPALAQTIVKDRGALAKALEDAEASWLEASDAYERARTGQSTTDAA
jgi:ATP-binding cassette, subfamily F, member 3